MSLSSFSNAINFSANWILKHSKKLTQSYGTNWLPQGGLTILSRHQRNYSFIFSTVTLPFTPLTELYPFLVSDVSHCVLYLFQTTDESWRCPSVCLCMSRIQLHSLCGIDHTAAADCRELFQPRGSDRWCVTSSVFCWNNWFSWKCLIKQSSWSHCPLLCVNLWV